MWAPCALRKPRYLWVNDLPHFLMKLCVHVRVVVGGQIHQTIFSAPIHSMYLSSCWNVANHPLSSFCCSCHGTNWKIIYWMLIYQLISTGFSNCILKRLLWSFRLIVLISFYLICRLLRFFNVYLLTCLGSWDRLMSLCSIFLEHIPNQRLQLQCTSS